MARVLEVDENGRLIITPDLLNNPAPHTRYVAENQEGGLLVRPESGEQTRLSWDEWLLQWDDLSKRVSDSWQSDKSAVEIVSEMRR